jgi:hypothetical protein
MVVISNFSFFLKLISNIAMAIVFIIGLSKYFDISILDWEGHLGYLMIGAVVGVYTFASVYDIVMKVFLGRLPKTVVYENKIEVE